MVALVIVSIAFPILLHLRNVDIELIARARALTQATLLAQQKVTETELLGFLPIGEQSGDFVDAPGESRLPEATINRDVGFTWTRHVNSTPFDRVREVRLRIVWSTQRNDDQIEVTTYVFAPMPF
jgi:general secretion pathway protein I